MKVRILSAIMLAVIAGLVVGCAEKAADEDTNVSTLTPPPYGSWIMYGGEKGLLQVAEFEKEETVLVLADSTYSLTFQVPERKYMFVESGKVYYDQRAQIARFTVISVSGMDWSAGTPRKMVLNPETVPFQRDPGTVYGLEWALQDSLMSLARGDQEMNWFVRTPR